MISRINGHSEEHQKLEAAYLEDRKQLIEKERKLRYDYSFKQSLSPVAKRACNIVVKLRSHESETVWGSNGTGADDEFPGMMFTLAKPKIKTTKLWEIVRKMPKGALLHSHLEAMVNIKWFWGVVLDTPGMYMFSDIPLDSQTAFENAKIQFKYSPEPVTGTPSDIFSSSYEASNLVSAKEAAKAFPGGVFTSSSPAGVDGYLAWLESKTTITPEESLKHHEGIGKIWAKFQSIFMVLNGAIWYEPIFRKFVRHLFEKLYEDGIFWVDLRVAFHMQFQEEGTGRILPKTEVLRVFGEILNQYKAENPEFWGSRIIWTSLRILDHELIKENMKECIEAKESFPEIVAGFDLVGQEDLGHSLHELIPELLWFKQECSKRNLEIPFYFHAGETVDEGSAADDNAFDAILLGTKRIGHGYSLCRHPHLMELVKEKQICIETCPISNEVLRLTASILSHPLPELVAHGVPTTINNDDPGILGQEDSGSLSHDYWQALQAFGNFGLGGIGSLARTSVKFATYDDHMDLESKVRLDKLALWDSKWEEFCAWVVEAFGEWEK